MTVSDFVIPVFLVAALVLLVVLWRRGPEKRGAFFVAGLLVVGASFVLAVAEDTLDDDVNGIATSDTSPLPELLEQWQGGDFEPGTTKSKVKPTPAVTRPPAATLEVDPQDSTKQPQARLHERVPIEDCWSRKLDKAPRAEAVITCPAGERVEVTYAQFGSIDDLEDWWEQEAGSVRTWPTPTAASRCESGANAEAAWHLDGADGPAGRFACHLPDLLAAVSWTDTSLLIGGRVDGDTTVLPDIYSRWSRGEFDLDRTEPVGEPEPTKGPTANEPATERHTLAGLFPPNWTVARADPDEHFRLYPVIEDDVQWQPVAYATDGTDECALIDATMYADELGFDTVEDALEWELTGFDGDADRAWARLVSVTSLSSPKTATGKYLVWALEEIAYVDVEPESGEFERHYLHHDGTRWVYFSCRSSDPPDDRWLPRALAVSYQSFEQLVQPVPTPVPPTPSLREERLRDLVPLKDCESRPTRTVAGADAVISCDAADGIGVDYMTFQSPDALQAWWDRHAGSTESVPGVGAIERCEAGEAVESGWYLERVNRLAGRYLCQPATVVRLPTVAWTYEPLLLGGRVTSGDHDLPDLYRRWRLGDYGVDQG